MAPKISTDMRKHYLSMFRKFKARVRAIEKTGLDLDIATTAIANLEKLGIDAMKPTLSERDIAMLSKGTVLEKFLENKLSTAAGRKKVLKEISSKLDTKYESMSSSERSQMANFLTTTSYSLALSLGILNSDILADVFENMDSDLSDIEVEYAVDEVTKQYLSGSVKQKDIYQAIMDKLDYLSKL